MADTVKLIRKKIHQNAILKCLFEKVGWIFSALGLNQDEVKNLTAQWYLSFTPRGMIFFDRWHELGICFPFLKEKDTQYFAVISICQKPQSRDGEVEIAKIVILHCPENISWFHKSDLRTFIYYTDTQEVATYSRTTSIDNYWQETLLIQSPTKRSKHPAIQPIIKKLQQS